MSKGYTLSKEQAYHAYETYSSARGVPTQTFDSFTDEDVAVWQKIADAFYSFTAIPCNATQAA